jgi:peptidoglycan hydrolase-like protein with peptidoglycan-binding domain
MEQLRMSLLRLTKLPIIAAIALLSAPLSLAGAHTEDHPKPVHHKAQKAPHHAAPKATNHSEEAKAGHPETPKPAHHTSKKSRKKRTRGQQAIDGERARQIQEALVREHYMKAQPSGTWDSATQEAMRRYQADQGWQSKTVPDARALIRLGLGPDHGHLLNPESAMITDPQLPHGNQTARPLISPVSSTTNSSVQPTPRSNSIATPAAVISPTR